MKRSVVIAMVVLACLGTSAAATAGRVVHAWTASKAERVLTRDATVQLAAPERAALEDELRQKAMVFSALAHGAAEVGDSQASLAYERIAQQYRSALWSVKGGIDIAEADCAGSGREFVAHRFRRFDCIVTSEVLRVPTTELETTADGDWPSIVEREPRLVGPFLTQLRARVTGNSSLAYE
jgi:hypothetical protein